MAALSRWTKLESTRSAERGARRFRNRLTEQQRGAVRQERGRLSGVRLEERGARTEKHQTCMPFGRLVVFINGSDLEIDTRDAIPGEVGAAR